MLAEAFVSSADNVKRRAKRLFGSIAKMMFTTC